MKVNGNGLVEIYGEKTKERGFFCMKLLAFLNTEAEPGTEAYAELWEQRFNEAKLGACAIGANARFTQEPRRREYNKIYLHSYDPKGVLRQSCRDAEGTKRVLPFPRTFRAKQIEAIRSRNRRGNKAGRTTSKREGKSPANFAFRGF